MQCRLTSSHDTPRFGQSSPAIPVNLRCISTVLNQVVGSQVARLAGVSRAVLDPEEGAEGALA
jgi:hypothetical protein